MKLKEKTKKDTLSTGRDAATKTGAPAADLTDSVADREKLRPDTAYIDLPDVEDIPGQEFIQPPTLESFVDDTLSSADEEAPVKKKKKKSDSKDDAVSILEDEDAGRNDSADSDDDVIRRAALDDTDDDGDPLNEGSFDKDLVGDDLDLPGTDDDDEDEAIGEEDEENNVYSDDNDREDKEGRE